MFENKNIVRLSMQLRFNQKLLSSGLTFYIIQKLTQNGILFLNSMVRSFLSQWLHSSIREKNNAIYNKTKAAKQEKDLKLKTGIHRKRKIV